MADDTDDFMLTTVDNPWNPYTNYDEWFAWDQAAGYNTPGYLARIAVVSGNLSESDMNLAISNAIDEIVSINVNGLYRRVNNPNTSNVVAS